MSGELSDSNESDSVFNHYFDSSESSEDVLMTFVVWVSVMVPLVKAGRVIF